MKMLKFAPLLLAAALSGCAPSDNYHVDSVVRGYRGTNDDHLVEVVQSEALHSSNSTNWTTFRLSCTISPLDKKASEEILTGVSTKPFGGFDYVQVGGRKFVGSPRERAKIVDKLNEAVYQIGSSDYQVCGPKD